MNANSYLLGTAILSKMKDLHFDYKINQVDFKPYQNIQCKINIGRRKAV